MFQSLTKFSTLILSHLSGHFTLFSSLQPKMLLSFCLLLQLRSLAVQSCSEACRPHCFVGCRSTTNLTEISTSLVGKPCLWFQQLQAACLFMGRAVRSSCQRDIDSVPSLLPVVFFQQVSPSNSFNSGAKLESLGILAYLHGLRADVGISFEVST